jgi:hypothetical protein
MSKLLISESERNLILSMYNNVDVLNLTEQVNTTHDKKYDYKKEKNKYYYRLKGSNDWILATDVRESAIATKVFKEAITPNTNPVKSLGNVPQKNVGTPQSFCQKITKNSTDIKDLPSIVKSYQSKYTTFSEDKIFAQLNMELNIWSTSYTNQGIPKEISCEMALNHIRPGYKDKNLVVVDTYNKLLYVFDKDGKFIGKTVIISGKHEQSLDPKVIAKSLLTWDEQANKLGFTYKSGVGYVDKTGKGRKYSADLIYDDTDKSKGRFLPKGIYTTSKGTTSDSIYAGKQNNVVSLFDGNKEISQAIHGYYVEQPRTQALAAAKKVLSNPNDPSIGKEFLKLVQGGKVNLEQSGGCFNVPTEFLPILRKYVVNSYVFNIGEDRKNYLVQSDKVENYFDKMMSSDSCPSPESVGAVPLEGLA